jgi:hypothetical protein
MGVFLTQVAANRAEVYCFQAILFFLVAVCVLQNESNPK